MSDREGSPRWPAALASAVVLAVYLSGLSGAALTVFWSPDEGAKLLQARTFRFDGGPSSALPYLGQGLDPELRFYAHRSADAQQPSLYPTRNAVGHIDWYWPIWFPLLTAAALAMFGSIGPYVVPVASGWAVALISGRLAAEIDRRLQAPTILVVGLATPVYFYSLRLWEHTLASALALVAVCLFVRGGGRVAALVDSLPWLVAALLLRLEMMALLVAIVVAAAVSRHAAAPAPAAAPRRTALAGALAGLLVALFAFTVTDRHATALSLAPGHWARLGQLPRQLGALLLDTADHFGPRVAPALTALAAVGALACVVGPFLRRRAVGDAVTLFALSALALLSAALVTLPQNYRCLHGLIPVAPFVALAALALPTAWHEPASRLAVLAAVSSAYAVIGVAAVLVNGAVDDAPMLRGLEWGPRYLLTLYPLLVVLGWIGVRQYWQSSRARLLREGVVGLALFLAAMGFLLERRGLEEVERTRTKLTTWQAALGRGEPIVTDIWWLPAALADYYAREQVFVVGRAAEVGDWCRVAVPRGIATFTFASQRPLPDAARQACAPVTAAADEVVGGLHLTRFAPPAAAP